MQGISLLAENLLVSQEGLCSMELVSNGHIIISACGFDPTYYNNCYSIGHIFGENLGKNGNITEL